MKIRIQWTWGEFVNEKERQGECGLFIYIFSDWDRTCVHGSFAVEACGHSSTLRKFFFFFIFPFSSLPSVRGWQDMWWWIDWPTAINGLHQWYGIRGGGGAHQRARGVWRRGCPPPLLRPARPHQRVGLHHAPPSAWRFLLPGKLKCITLNSWFSFNCCCGCGELWL